MAKADKKNDTDGGFLDTISDAIEDVMEDAMDDIKEAGEAVVQGVNTLVENIKDGAEVVVDTVQDAIEDVGEALGIIAVDEVRREGRLGLWCGTVCQAPVFAICLMLVTDTKCARLFPSG